MREENSYETWQNYHDSYDRQLQRIELDKLVKQFLCDIKESKKEVIETTNKYEYILIRR